MSTKGVRQGLARVVVLLIALAVVPAARPQTAVHQPPVTPGALEAAGLPSRHATELARVAASATSFSVLYSPEDRAPVAIGVLLKPESMHLRERIVQTTLATLALFDEWYGPFPLPQLTVIDASWDAALAGASYPGVVVIATRWREPAADVALERTLIAALARQYWQGLEPAGDPRGWFEEGIVLYSGARAMHQYLDGRHFASGRYFGGFIPYVIRSVALTPRIADPRPRLRHFTELEEPAQAPWRAWPAGSGSEAQRVATALATLERYLGWPALQWALSSYRDRFAATGGTVSDFAAVLSDQRGQDVSWYFDEALRFDARFDYAVEAFESQPDAAHPSRYRTTVRLGRRGDGVFAGTPVPIDGAFADSRALPVSVAFEDGTEVREWWDGRRPQLELAYDSASPAVLAAVDPDGFLLLDANRANNVRRLVPPAWGSALRPTARWLIWLQDLLITYSVLL